jgi:hypothetical protein
LTGVSRKLSTSASNHDLQLNGAAVGRQIEEPALMAAVHPLPSAIGASASGNAASSRDDDPIWSDLDAIDHQAGGRQ